MSKNKQTAKSNESRVSAVGCGRSSSPITLHSLLLKKQGIRLDIGCGGNKQPGFVGMDRRALPGVDIVHDLEAFPWPLPDQSCQMIVASHIIEHIKPWLFIGLMDECWRVLKPGGQMAVSMPYGVSFGFVQDPTHCNACNEATWQYFDPRFPLYGIYRPRPWTIGHGTPVWSANGNMEVLLTKTVMSEE